jgi:hypothetical protein
MMAEQRSSLFHIEARGQMAQIEKCGRGLRD